MLHYRGACRELRFLLCQKNNMPDGSVLILSRLAGATWSGTLIVLSDILLRGMQRS
jgi:hypothetical protein